MGYKLNLIALLCFVYGSTSEVDLEWRAENSIILRSLGWIPTYYTDVTEYAVIDDDTALESFHLIEGDIIPDGDETEDRTAVNKKQKLWPKGRIPYVIEPTLDNHKKEIRNAMKYIENVTCLHFVKRTVEKNYVRIFNGRGCNSYVGMLGRGAQNLSLGSGCYYLGRMMHELLHATGFYHEQSRSDRDDYIYIHWDNIKSGHEKNFIKRRPDQNLLLTPYDYESIMHYGSYTFSKNKNKGLRTMTPKKKGIVLKRPAEKTLSRSDIKRIAKLYNCTVPRSLSDSTYKAHSF